tara:strand:- start:104 stop:466 length:363 start_codon:yes stop_codon:yes gene_type:complete
MIEICLKNIRCYSFHGCLKEEQILGGEYLVSLWVRGEFGKSVHSDALKDTVDYVLLNNIVLEEMATRSKLLESVADRVVSRVLREDGRVNQATASISKLSPPVGGEVESVSVKISKKRDA